MIFSDAKINDAGNFAWLNLSRGLSGAFLPLLTRMRRSIHERENLRERRDAIEGTTAALGVVLGNLLRTHQLDPTRYVAVLLSPNEYRKGQLNPFGIGYRALDRVIDFLATHDPPLIEFRKGAHFKDHGFPTKIRMTKALEELLAPITLETINQLTQARTNNTSPGADPQSISVQSLFAQGDLPLLRLKNEEKEVVEYKPTDETERMLRRLERFNAFLEQHWIDLLLPDDEFRKLMGGKRREETDEFGDAADPNERRVDLVFQRGLYRVFNNGTFEQGGRFYGGWWQNIPGAYRKFITVNWAPTVELDFSNMQAAMLYAMEGLKLDGDAYSIDGIDPIYRELIKITFFKLINAKGRVRAPHKEELPDGWSWEQLQQAVRDKHAPIADHFNSGIGIKLQRINSDIAETVMLTMMERDVLVLPVHDSFITWPAQREALHDAMAQAYKEHMRGTIQIEADVSFLETELPEGANELDEFGVYSFEEAVDDYDQRPEFASYRQRKLDFLAQKDEAWRWRFYPRGA